MTTTQTTVSEARETYRAATINRDGTKIPARVRWWDGEYQVERLSDAGAWEVVDSSDDRDLAVHDARHLAQSYGRRYRVSLLSTGRVACGS
jgi:hypothetical protein